jgi:hypothetical protein
VTQDPYRPLMILKRSLIVLAAIVITLSGCGDGGGGTSTPTAAAGGQGASAGATSVAAAGDACGGTADKVKQHLTSAQVTAVKTNGQCTLVSIETKLADDQTAAAKALCESAAEVAYSADTNAISVHSASGKELAQGIAKAPCIASM